MNTIVHIDLWIDVLTSCVTRHYDAWWNYDSGKGVTKGYRHSQLLSAGKAKVTLTAERKRIKAMP